MPHRDTLTYPRLTVRKSGRWGVWPTTARVSIRYHPDDRDHLLIICPDFRRAHDAAQCLIARHPHRDADSTLRAAYGREDTP